MPIEQFNESTRLTDPALPSSVLASKQFALYVEALAEGELAGFPSAIDGGYTQGTANYNLAALKDIYLNGTQILNSSANISNVQDSDYNFRGVDFEPRFGKSNQTYIAGINDITTEKTDLLPVEVTNGAPITRTITNTNINAVRVTVAFPRLQKYKDDGGIDGTSVSLSIQIQYNGGSYSTIITDTVSGRSTDAYFRDYKIDLSGAFPINVRVIRNTANASDPSKLFDKFNWMSWTEIIYDQKPYLNTAHCALRFDAEQFPQVPARMFRLRGTLIKIPSNASVRADGSLSFSGSWDGTFSATKVACTCPSWALYDLLINERYGFGSHLTESQIDKYTFYSVSVYNNEQIDDMSGNGTTHARFTLNVSIQQQHDAYKLVNSICGVMRCMPYWSNGGITISQDAPKDSSYLFTLANTADGGFTYSGSSIRTRATQINVSYFDNETQSIDWEEVSDANYQAKYGIVQKNVKAWGCTSRGEANRLGRWMLYTLFNEGEVVSFTTTIEAGVMIAPGDVIDVADPVRSGLRKGGLIQSATTTTVTVDNEDQTDLDNTNNPKLSVILSDGTIEQRDVSDISGAVITVSSAFSSAPNSNSVWILENDTTLTSQWRVVSIAEDQELYTISAVTYNATKFNYVETGAPLSTRKISTLADPVSAPSNLSAVETIYVENNQAKVKILVSWTPQNRVTQYRIQWRKDNGNYVQRNVSSSDYEILDSTSGVYEIRVFAYNAALRPSAIPAELTLNAVGKTAKPANVSGLSFESINLNSGRLSWTQSTEADVLHGGKVHIRSSSLTNGSATWSNSVDLINAIAGNSTEAIIPKLPGEILVKFADDGGRFSTTEASIIILNVSQTGETLVVKTQREDTISPTPFSGSKTNTEYDASLDALKLTSSGSNINSSGSYTFASVLDLEGVFALDLQRRFVTRAIRPSDLVDVWPDVDARSDWDGDIVDNVNASLSVRTTNDNPSSSPTWGDWTSLKNGIFTGRGFQFKTDLTSADTTENILIDELGYVAELEQRTEQSVGVVASGTAAKTISFNKSFWTGTSSLGGASAYLPSITLIPHNQATGDYIEMGTVTGSQFTVTFKSSGGSAVNRNFTWQAVGYGRSV